jgi:hypothetical protein
LAFWLLLGTGLERGGDTTIFDFFFFPEMAAAEPSPPFLALPGSGVFALFFFPEMAAAEPSPPFLALPGVLAFCLAPESLFTPPLAGVAFFPPSGLPLGFAEDLSATRASRGLSRADRRAGALTETFFPSPASFPGLGLDFLTDEMGSYASKSWNSAIASRESRRGCRRWIGSHVDHHRNPKCVAFKRRILLPSDPL